MSNVNRKLYPDLDTAHARIDRLEETIAYYERREAHYVDRLQRISKITVEE